MSLQIPIFFGKTKVDDVNLQLLRRIVMETYTTIIHKVIRCDKLMHLPIASIIVINNLSFTLNKK